MNGSPPHRPVLAAPVAGFGAYFVRVLLDTYGPGQLDRLRSEVDAGRLHPIHLEEARRTWAAIERAANEWLTWRASVDGNAEVPPAETPPPSAVIATREAADMLRISERRVRQMLADGALTGRRAGRVWLVDRASVAILAATRSAA